ncbi:MAG TPA: hypothetical protein VGK09_08265 [Rhodocyclaceae bacterium]|jgi:hypothetical protein
MAKQHTPARQIQQAKQIARDYGMHIAECKTNSGTDYVVYRDTDTGDVRLGKRSSPSGLFQFVSRLAYTH